MRAVLEADPHSGSGYAILTLYGIDPVDLPFPVLRRLSDGLVLDSAGWRKAPAYLVPEKREDEGNVVRFFLSPEIVDNMAADQRYMIEIPGTGSCALEIASLSQSTVIDLNGQDMYAPPPESPVQNPAGPSYDKDAPFLQNRIYEGVEPNPVVEGKGEFSATPTGLAPAASPEKKRKGCLLLSVAAIFIWAAGAWLLWNGSLKAPESAPAQAHGNEETEKAHFFEIIPSARESSFVEDETPDAPQGK